MLFLESSVASIGAVLASVASLNATATLTTYSAYPVVSGITPVTVYVTTLPISAVSLSAVFVILGASVFKFTVVVVSSTVTKED